jgi:hypothetical protein
MNIKKTIIAAILALLPSMSLAGGHSSGAPAGVKIEPLLSTMTSPLGNKLVYPEGEAKIVSAKFTIPVGGEAARHTHPAPFYGYILQGSLTAIYDDGTMKTFIEGESFVESSFDPIVRTANLGSKDTIGIMVFMGVEGMPPLVPAEPLPATE